MTVRRATDGPRPSLGAAAGAGSPPDDTVVDRKRALRAALLARRRAQPTDARTDDDLRRTATLRRAIEWRLARRVCIYWSFGTEPSTHGLIADLRERGVPVLLPVVTDAPVLDWAVHTGRSDLVRAPLGGWEPSGPRLGPDAPRRCDVMVVPALAADRHGYRMGRGGGYYDRALAHIDPTHTWTCALLNDHEVLRTGLPTEPHDIAVDALATPNGLILARAARD